MPKLSGRITTVDGPAPSAVVEVHNSQGDVLDQVQVDDDGRYTYHLSPGSWSLNVWDAHGNRGKRDVTLERDDVQCDVEIGAQP